MRYTILLRVDEEGETPILLEGSELPEGDHDSCWRFVASVDDRGVALQVVEMVRARGLEER